MALSIAAARLIVLLREQSAEWIPGEGAPCILCRTTGLVRSVVRNEIERTILRYLKCPACGMPFKSIETLQKEPPDDKPEHTQGKSRKKKRQR